MVLTEFDEEKYEAMIREEGREERKTSKNLRFGIKKTITN